MVVVMFLMGMVLTLALPRFGFVGDDEKLRAAARGLAAQAVEAHSQAVTESRPWFLCLDLDKAESWVARTRPGDLTENEQEESVQTLPSGLRFTDAAHPDDGLVREGVLAFAFQANGGNEPGTFHLINADGREMTVFLRPYLGRTEIFDGYLREEVE